MSTLGLTPDAINKAMARAENLFRQALAENRHDIFRVQEAERYLDQLAVSRNALRNALRASAMARASHIRVMLMEFQMSYGRRPSAAEGGEQQAMIRLLDPTSGTPLMLLCSDRGITLELARR